MSMTSEGLKPKRTAPLPLWDECDILHLRGALVALNKLLNKLPDSQKLNAAGHRVCDKACDARLRLRELLAEYDSEITLKAMGVAA